MAELQLEGAAPDASSVHTKVLRAINECTRMLAAMPQPDATLALRVYWLRVRYETIAGDPEAACQCVTLLPRCRSSSCMLVCFIVIESRISICAQL
jgi:hypothetical protein